METIVITVDCKDIAYGRRLAETLPAMYNGFIIYTIDTKGTEQIEENHPDVLVTDKHDRDANPNMTKVFLCEKKYDANIQENRCFKYGSVSAIVAAILSAYTEATGKVIHIAEDTDCPCIGVVSAAGGTGATTLTKGLAQHLAVNIGKKVLVLSLDDFLSVKEERQQSTFSFRHYLYFLQEENWQRISSSQMFTYNDQYGVTYFTPDSVRNSFFEASKELAAEMMHHLKKHWGFDVFWWILEGNRHGYRKKSFLTVIGWYI